MSQHKKSWRLLLASLAKSKNSASALQSEANIESKFASGSRPLRQLTGILSIDAFACKSRRITFGHFLFCELFFPGLCDFFFISPKTQDMSCILEDCTRYLTVICINKISTNHHKDLLCHIFKCNI